jgi:hypothetical protein
MLYDVTVTKDKNNTNYLLTKGLRLVTNMATEYEFISTGDLLVFEPGSTPMPFVRYHKLNNYKPTIKSYVPGIGSSKTYRTWGWNFKKGFLLIMSNKPGDHSFVLFDAYIIDCLPKQGITKVQNRSTVHKCWVEFHWKIPHIWYVTLHLGPDRSMVYVSFGKMKKDAGLRSASVKFVEIFQIEEA